MFKGVKKLLQKPFENTTIYNDKGKIVTSSQELDRKIQHHFKNHFHEEDVTEIEKRVREPKPLAQIITTEEIVKALTKISNQKSPGKDNIPADLLKSAPNIAYQQISMIMNNTFLEHQPNDFGIGILFPLPKPNKPKGAVKSLRPIILLEISRKTLSKILLNRIQPKVTTYLSKRQSAYRIGRSMADIVWTNRWILSKMQEQVLTIYSIRLDMSSAFNTIWTDKLIEITEEFLEEDEMRILRVLLSDTNLEIKIQGAYTKYRIRIE